MNIAFISYEYPPDTATGGIATYVGQAARIMAQRGHHVEVFAGSPYRTLTEVEDGVTVHRIHEAEREFFAESIAEVFARRNAEVQFDVLEGPEYKVEAGEAVKRVPSIPLVVKLHTPSYLINRMNQLYPPFVKARHIFGAARRGIPHLWHPEWGDERRHAMDADEITTPSQSLGEMMVKAWKLDQTKVVHIPNFYTPAASLLQIPADTATATITFLGRLEQRKGVLDLAKAIPGILRRHPQTRFRFVGKPMSLSKNGLDMRQYLQQYLRHHAASVEFADPVPLSQIPAVLAATDICVFPSLWENFPNVCLESMAAARGIVASNAGGMAEMLDGGRCGELVSPHRPQQIADAVCRLLDDPARRIRLALVARERVLSEYGADRIGALQEASYARAIERRLHAGPRRTSRSPADDSATDDPREALVS